MKEPFTKEEEEIMRLIVEAHNKFSKLKSTHSNEIKDWVNNIHNLQSVLSLRVLRRDYPNYYQNT